MKIFSVIQFLLFILLLLAYQCAHAQDYMVSVKGDTIKGELRPFSGPEKKVQVVTTEKKKITLPMLQVRSYFYKGDRYEPVRNDAGYTFMKVLKPGYLTLYGFQIENQTGYDGRFLAKKDGSYLEVPNLTFKKLMVRFLQDCSDVSERIDNGTLGKRELHTIVDEYNACIEQRTQQTNQLTSQKQVQQKKSNVWDTLEEKVKAKPDFTGKTDALEMIGEIKGKISRNEKVPNFMIEGLKDALSSADVNAELEMALKELNN